MKILVSVIIPTFQRESLFLACLESLSKQSYPQDKFEVIAIYDGEECPYNKKKLKPKLKNIKNSSLFCIKHSGAATVRNFGISKAKGSLILTIDDDCRADSNWIFSFVVFMEKNKVIAAGGTVQASKPTTFIQEYIAFKRLLRQPVKDKTGQIITIITANACFRKQHLNQVNGFYNGFTRSGGEDLDLSMRLRELGSLGYSVDSIVFHFHRSSLIGLVKQHIFYGRGAYLACQKNNFDCQKLKFYTPNIFGFMKYLVYIFIRIFSVSIPEYWNKKLPLGYWIPYAILDIIRKLSFSVGATLEYYNIYHGHH